MISRPPMSYRDPTANATQLYQEQEIRASYGCEACESFGRAGECIKYNVSIAIEACNEWELNLDWRPYD